MPCRPASISASTRSWSLSWRRSPSNRRKPGSCTENLDESGVADSIRRLYKARRCMPRASFGARLSHQCLQLRLDLSDQRTGDSSSKVDGSGTPVDAPDLVHYDHFTHLLIPRQCNLEGITHYL